MRNASLRLKLLAAIGLLFLIGMAALIALSARALHQSNALTRDRVVAELSAQAEVTLAEASRATGEEITRLLGNAYATTETLATQLTNTARGNGQPFERADVKRLTRDALASNPAMSALYAQFEPAGYDDRDAANAGNHEHSSDIGTLELYYVREDGELVYYETDDPDEKYLDDTDEFGIREAEWYLCSRDSGEACLLDPYLYEIEEGYEEVMTTLAIPVMVGGTFRGLVGTDINLPVLQQRIEAIAARLFEGSGDAMLVSQRGFLAASSRFPEALGEHLDTLDEGLIDLTDDTGLQQLGGRWYYSQEIGVEGVPQRWTLLVSVPETAILAPALALTDQLEADAGQAVGALILLGVVVILAGGAGIYWLLTSITRPIGEMARRMQYLASSEGDLTQQLEVTTHAELIELARGFNGFTDKLREMIQTMKQQNAALATDARQMASHSEQVGQSAGEQAEKLDSVVTAVNEMSTTATEVARLANHTAEAAHHASDHIHDSQSALNSNRERVERLSGLMSSSSDQVGQVAKRSEDIYGILETIQGIAEQTNLLALNAAIEAARAGEQGRGFAVVADEVRQLAARTQESTREVDELIKGLQQDVDGAVKELGESRSQMDETVRLTRESSERLDQAVGQVGQINDNAVQVATAAEEQSQVNEDINRSISEIGTASRELSEAAEAAQRLTRTTHDAIRALEEQLDRLKA